MIKKPSQTSPLVLSFAFFCFMQNYCASAKKPVYDAQTEEHSRKHIEKRELEREKEAQTHREYYRKTDEESERKAKTEELRKRNELEAWRQVQEKEKQRKAEKAEREIAETTDGKRVIQPKIPDFDFPDAGMESRKKCFSDNGEAVPKKTNVSLVDATKTGKLAIFRCVHEKGASLNSFEMVLMDRALTGDGKWEAGKEKEGTVWPVEVAIQNNNLDIIEFILSRVTRIYSSDEQWRREEALDFAYKYKNEQAKILIRKLIYKDLEKYFKGKKFILEFFSDISLNERTSICKSAKNVEACMNFPGFMFYPVN